MENSRLSWRSSVLPLLIVVLVFVLAKFSAPRQTGLAPENKEAQIAALGLNSRDWLSEVEPEVLPPDGFQSRISLADAAVKLVRAGVIDEIKFEGLYQSRGGLPPELEEVLVKAQTASIKLTRANAGIYLNILWALGLANNLAINKESPLNGDMLYNFASTGGWTLGRAENGGAYFNKFEIIKLSPAQESLVRRVAENIFRPCCDNSTFFQDCNHGSAMFGLLQLGAAQGLTEEELYREALTFNSFWFPQNYLETAVYFKAVKGLDWPQVDAKLALSKTYSSYSGWSKNIAQELRRRKLIQEEASGAACGV